MFDWGKISDNQLAPVNVSLSPDTLALCLSFLSSYPFRFEWLVDGIEPTDGEWDDIDAALALAFKELNTETGLYRLHADIELVADVSSYTLIDLASLPGRDLIIQADLAATGAGAKHLNVRFNGVTDLFYDYQYSKFETSTGYVSVQAANKFYFHSIVAANATPQINYHHLQMELNHWKELDRWQNIDVKARGRYLTLLGTGLFHPIGMVDTIEFWPHTDDLKAGSRFSVFTRG